MLKQRQRRVAQRKGMDEAKSVCEGGAMTSVLEAEVCERKEREEKETE